MSKIKEYFEENYSEFIISSKSQSERKNSFSIKSNENFSKVLLEAGVFSGRKNSSCECFFIREVNDETYFLELKGRSSNVIKGIRQIIASISETNNLIDLDFKKVNGFVIGSSTPKANLAIKKLKREFKSKFGKDIVISTGSKYVLTI